MKLGRGPLGDATYQIYQGFRPCGFREDDFFMLHFTSLCKHVTPGVGPFLTQGHNLNKLGRGSLGDATNQISRLYALWFKTRRF